MNQKKTMNQEKPIGQEKEKLYDIIIIGAGTAGLSAAIYGVRAGKKVLVMERGTYGGQIVSSSEIENYPGIGKISGYEFAQGLYNQADGLGAEFCFEEVETIQVLDDIKIVEAGQNKYQTKSIILATGAKNRPLGLEHEEEWIGAGISYCATCDGAFYKGKDVAVVGGGNTALEDALFLTEYCRKVYLIHRRDTFRGEEALLEELKRKDNIVFLLKKNVIALKGNEKLQAVTVKNEECVSKECGNSLCSKEYDLEVEGLFIAIGQIPNNERFASVVALDEKGYILAGEDCKTSRTGIFAAGDCRTKSVRQLVTAAADGAVAALSACQV